MRTGNVSSNSFGLKITDNMPFQTLQHLWIKKCPNEALPATKALRNCANDSFELTFNEFVPGKPCKVTLRKQPFAPEEIFFEFVSLKPKVVKRGRPKKESMIQGILSPTQFVEEISRHISEYSQRIKS